MAEARRDEALDCAKGIAIFAVVLFHVTRGFTASGQLSNSFGSRFADTFAYGFHVQTFFLIAGYLAFSKADDGRYQLRRQASFYYTYLLWSLLSWVLSVAFSHAVNKPVGWDQLAWIPLVPIQHFWFILALMVGTAALGVLRTSFALLAGTALCVAMCYALAAANAAELQGALAIYTGSLPFLLIGGWLKQRRSPPVVTVPTALTALLAYVAAIWWITTRGGSPTVAIALPVSLTGAYAAYAMGHFATRNSLSRELLTTLGRHSYVIYLAHVITGAGTRILLARLLPNLDLVLALMISLIAAIVLPILFERAARKMGLTIPLGLDPLPLRFNGPHTKVPAA